MKPMTATCRRFAAALDDGAPPLDDPRWSAHLDGCAACRAVAQMDARLRARLETLAPAEGRPELEGDRPRRLVDGAFRAFERRDRVRRRVLVAGGLVASLLLGWALLGPGAEPGGPADDPLAQAAALRGEVLPPCAPPRPERLKEDPSLVERCLEAVQRERGIVRRAALTVLAFGQVDLGRATLEEVLGTWNEDLESPVEVASGAGGARHVAEALALRRTATLQAALKAAWWQASRGGEAVSWQVVVPFLAAPEAGVRQQALLALGADSTYAPGAEVETLLRDPREPLDVRQAAGACLIQRAGEQGAGIVAAHLADRLDEELELALASPLVSTRAGRALADERLAAATTPLKLALLYAREPGRELVPDLLARLLTEVARSGAVEHALSLVEVCRRAGRDEQRIGVQQLWRANQARWRAADADGTLLLARTLIRWDEGSDDPTRWDLALEICEQMRESLDAGARKFLARVRAGADPASSRRAARLLED
jgi:hypothetical protein